MFRFISTLFLLLFLCIMAYAQITTGLVSYYSFDNCDGTDDSGNAINALLINNPGCGCGVKGSALELDGIDDAVIIPGASSFMSTIDFSISLYFKSTGVATQDLVSRKENCDDENAFSVQVSPSINRISTKIAQNSSKRIDFTHSMDPSVCWQHFVFVRKGNFQSIWLNGELIEERNSVTRVDISNNNIELEIAGGPCIGLSDLPFQGFIDELRLYRRALNIDDIQELYCRPDKIITPDTLVFLGTSLDIVSNPVCPISFNWSPGSGVDDINIPNPTITPTETTVYTLFVNQGDCVARDSVRVAVVDPDQLDCRDIFLANAFTPNFDGNNDVFGVSNPFAVSDFISFEVFDRFGSQLFYSTDVFQNWDGTFKGEEVVPGVFLYRVRFRCDGLEEVKTGSVTLIR